MSFENSMAPSSDLRSASREQQRDVEHRHKWSRGVLHVKGRDRLDVNHQKPAPRAFQAHSIVPKLDRTAYAKSRDSCKLQSARKFDMLSANDGTHVEDNSSADDSSNPASAEEDNTIVDPTNALPEAGVMYSFDNERSPATGSQILGAVLDQALERYQDNETLQLVHDEYELVDANGDSVMTKSGGKKKNRLRAVKKHSANDEDDYEFV